MQERHSLPWLYASSSVSAIAKHGASRVVGDPISARELCGCSGNSPRQTALRARRTRLHTGDGLVLLAAVAVQGAALCPAHSQKNRGACFYVLSTTRVPPEESRESGRRNRAPVKVSSQRCEPLALPSRRCVLCHSRSCSSPRTRGWRAACRFDLLSPCACRRRPC